MMTMTQYLLEAPERDKKHQEQLKLLEEIEDRYFDELSNLIDQHPIGPPIFRTCYDKTPMQLYEYIESTDPNQKLKDLLDKAFPDHG